MPVSFFSRENVEKILNFANDTHPDKRHHGFTHWLEWWLMVDKKRKSCSIRCNNFQMVKKDLEAWFKYGWIAPQLDALFLLRSENKRFIRSPHYNDLLEHMLSWFRVINRLEIECPADLEQDLIKLLGLSLALLNCFTAAPQGHDLDAMEEPENDDLAEEDKISILQGYYYWLELKYSRSPQALAILQNRAATLKPVEKTCWKREQTTFRYVEDSLPLQDHLECSLCSKSTVCYVFLEYWLAYYDPDKGLRAKRQTDLQEGTDFLIPAVDFMRKYQRELSELDDKYTYGANDIPAPRPRLCGH